VNAESGRQLGNGQLSLQSLKGHTRAGSRLAPPKESPSLAEAVIDGALLFSEGCRRKDLVEAALGACLELFGRPPTLH